MRESRMNHGPIALDAVRAPLLDGRAWHAPGRAVSISGVHLLRGREAVAAMRGMLVNLGRRTGQTGAMDWLDYLLGTPTALQKIPYLALVGLDAGVNPARATADDIAGAVLLYEYRLAGRGVKVFATDDISGQRTVIAPIHIRTQVAEAVCRTLMEMGAAAALISFEGNTDARSMPRSRAGLTQVGRGRGYRMATRTREITIYLPLRETLDATLATMGKHTRRNLRYYRRRVEAEMGVEFVPCVEMRKDDFLEMNRMSTFPVPKAVAAWRYDAIQRSAGTILAGLRARDGRWLSLLGGRRHLQVAEIDWQMNLAGLPRHSLSTVMRSYVLEHEIGLGTKKLAFTGGTPHSIRHSFVSVNAVDIIMQRRCATAWALRRLSRWILPGTNFLGQALRDEGLSWTAC